MVKDNKSSKCQRKFESVKKRVKLLVEKCPSVIEYPKNTVQGIYMLYVNDFSDGKIIPFYVGKGTGSGGVQKRYIDHLNKLFELNRLSGAHLENVVLGTRVLHGAYFYLKLLKYMVDHSLNLDAVGCVLLEQCDEDAAFAREQHWIEELNAPFFGFNQLNSISLALVFDIPKPFNYLQIRQDDAIRSAEFWDYGFTRFNFRYGLNHSISFDEILGDKPEYLYAVGTIRANDAEAYEQSKKLRRIAEREEEEKEELELRSLDSDSQAFHFASEWVKRNGIRGWALQSDVVDALRNASPDLRLKPSSKNLDEKLARVLDKIRNRYPERTVRSFCSEYNFIGRLNGYWHPSADQLEEHRRNAYTVFSKPESYKDARLRIEGPWLSDILPNDCSYRPCPLGGRFRPFEFPPPANGKTTLQLRFELSGNSPSMRKRDYPRQREQVLRVDYRIASPDGEGETLRSDGAYIDCDINRHLRNQGIEYVLRAEYDQSVDFRSGGFKTWMAPKGKSPLTVSADDLLWRHSPEERKGRWNDDGPEYLVGFERGTGINKSVIRGEPLVALQDFLLPVFDEAKEKDWMIEVSTNATSKAFRETLVEQLCRGDESTYRKLMRGSCRRMAPVEASIPRVGKGPQE